MNTGRPAVFCRFAGCNLWSGRESDRATAVCRFCDTDFVGTDGPGGGKFADAASLAAAVRAAAPRAMQRPFAVLTGGEPALQLDAPLMDALHREGFEVAIETNGTVSLAARPDWICVSPKADAPLRVTKGDELKLVYRQDDALPERFEGLGFRHFLLQPMDGPERARFTREAVEYCRTHPGWRLSLQVHKILGIP
jgi:7-carboxy-7-deazaguanine synthase (Cx14CxxC type)